MIGWIVDALLASGLLMAAVLLVRSPVRRAFGPQVAYALWALPVLRLCLPTLPAGWWHPAAATRAGETITVLVLDPARAVAVAAPTTVPLGLLAALGWGIGAAGFLLVQLARHRAFCRRLLAGAEPLGEVNGVVLVASAAAPGPLAFGIRRRFVAFPRDAAERYDAEERALALAHELGHHARHDLLANWAALAALALHWFNPLAWRAFHAFRVDQELANDARVLAGRSAGERHAYACAIVKAAHPSVWRGAISTTCHLNTIADLKGRLRMLTTSTRSRRRLATGGAAVACLTAAGLALTASSSGAAAIGTGMHAALQATPVAPPAPPSSPAPSATTRTVKRIVVVRDGATKTYEGAEADAYLRDHDVPLPPAPPVAPGYTGATTQVIIRHRDKDGKTSVKDDYSFNVPEVLNQRCPGSDATRPVVDNREENGRRIIVVCTNRMAAMTHDAERIAANSDAIERDAIGSARDNLALARTSIEHERNLTPEQRAQALAGIAQAQAELDAKKN